ncbi:unnamed protein product [Choristocarpus tenellus]
MNNSAYRGGALYVGEHSITSWSGVTIFEGNSAGFTGGVVYADVSSYISWKGLTNFAKNSAVNGGVLFIWEKTVVFSNGQTNFAGNSASENGGVLHISADSIATFVGNTTFDGNSAMTGGAVYSTSNVQGQKFYGVTFQFNSAEIGGAVATYGTGIGTSFKKPTEYINCSFLHNVATSSGGGVESAFGQDNFKGSYFVNNLADVGGALRVGGTVDISGSLFERNWARRAGSAVSSAGGVTAMKNTSFDGNSFVCFAGKYLTFLEGNNTARYNTVCDGCIEWEMCENCSIQEGTLNPVCSSTLKHTTAGDNVTLETLTIDKGYWRIATNSEEILPCYNADACVGGQTGSSNFCEVGYLGPYCSVCDEKYATTLAFTCSKCSGTDGDGFLAVATILLGIIVLGFVLVVTHLMSTEFTDRSNGFLNRVMRALPLQAIKIVIVVWQISTQFASVANVTYPDVYESFLKGVDFINLDLGWIVSVGCIVDTDFHDRMLATTISPLVVTALLAGTYIVAVHRTRNSEDALLKVRHRHASMILLLTFLVYSPVSSSVFRMFACDPLDGKTYLRADYRILCTDSKHRALPVYAAMMIAVYPVGIPLLYAILLFQCRNILSDDSREGNLRVRPIADLWTPYRPERFYYEVVEYFRRIFLTGIVVFIAPNTAAQIAVTALLAFAFFTVSEVLSPYASKVDTWLSRWGHIVVFLTMFFALLLKVDVSTEDDDSQGVFSVFLVGIHDFMILAVVMETFYVAWSIR